MSTPTKANIIERGARIASRTIPGQTKCIVPLNFIIFLCAVRETLFPGTRFRNLKPTTWKLYE